MRESLMESVCVAVVAIIEIAIVIIRATGITIIPISRPKYEHVQFVGVLDCWTAVATMTTPLMLPMRMIERSSTVWWIVHRWIAAVLIVSLQNSGERRHFLIELSHQSACHLWYERHAIRIGLTVGLWRCIRWRCQRQHFERWWNCDRVI